MDLIPVDERNKWLSDLKPIFTEMNKLSDADKIQGFRNGVVDRFITHNALNYVLQHVALLDCDIEMLEKENEELRYKVDNLGNYDENRLKGFENKVVIVPSTEQEMKERVKRSLMKKQAKMRMLTNSVILANKNNF